MLAPDWWIVLPSGFVLLGWWLPEGVRVLLVKRGKFVRSEPAVLDRPQPELPAAA